jgi:hypothetical protein
MAQPSWALGVGDAVWGSRLAQPDPQAWTDAETTPTWPELPPPTADPDPTALAGDGRLLRPGPPPVAQRWLRLVAGRPGRPVPIALLAWGSAPLAAHGCTAWLLIGENAAWPGRQAGRRWSRQPHQQVKRGAVGVRRVVCRWPSQSPWLHPLEPTWLPGQRAVSEADRLLSAADLDARVDAYDGCAREAHVVMPKKVA